MRDITGYFKAYVFHKNKTTAAIINNYRQHVQALKEARYYSGFIKTPPAKAPSKNFWFAFKPNNMGIKMSGISLIASLLGYFAWPPAFVNIGSIQKPKFFRWFLGRDGVNGVPENRHYVTFTIPVSNNIQNREEPDPYILDI